MIRLLQIVCILAATCSSSSNYIVFRTGRYGMRQNQVEHGYSIVQKVTQEHRQMASSLVQYLERTIFTCSNAQYEVRDLRQKERYIADTANGEFTQYKFKLIIKKLCHQHWPAICEFTISDDKLILAFACKELLLKMHKPPGEIIFPPFGPMEPPTEPPLPPIVPSEPPIISTEPPIVSTEPPFVPSEPPFVTPIETTYPPEEPATEPPVISSEPPFVPSEPPFVTPIETTYQTEEPATEPPFTIEPSEPTSNPTDYPEPPSEPTFKPVPPTFKPIRTTSPNNIGEGSEEVQPRPASEPPINKIKPPSTTEATTDDMYPEYPDYPCYECPGGAGGAPVDINFAGGEYNSREGGHKVYISRDRRNHGRGAAGQPVRINFTGGKYGRRVGGSKIRIKGSGDNGYGKPSSGSGNGAPVNIDFKGGKYGKRKGGHKVKIG